MNTRTERTEQEYQALEERLSACENTLYTIGETLEREKTWLDRLNDSKAFKLAHLWERIRGQVMGCRYERRLFGRWLRKQPVPPSRFSYVYHLQKERDCAEKIYRQYIRESGRGPTPLEKEYLSFTARKIAGPDLTRLEFPQEKGLVSVVLPVYNGGSMLDESVQSVLAQTFSNFELIIVDDGSTDRTPERADFWASQDARIHVLHQSNKKIPGALNAGFAMAKGEFLTWTSADNRMHPNFLEIMVRYLEQHPQTAMCFANMRVIDENGVPLVQNDWYPQEGSPEVVSFPIRTAGLNVCGENTIGAAFLYRRAVPELLGGYDPCLYTVEDYDYWIRVQDFFSLEHIQNPAPVYDYRLHSSSLTARSKELHINEMRSRLMGVELARQEEILEPVCWLVQPGNFSNSWCDLCRKVGDPVISQAHTQNLERYVEVSIKETGAGARCVQACVKGCSTEWSLCITVGKRSAAAKSLHADDLETAFRSVRVFAAANWAKSLSAPLPEVRSAASIVLYVPAGLPTQTARQMIQEARERAEETQEKIQILVLSGNPLPPTNDADILFRYLPAYSEAQAWNSALRQIHSEWAVFMTPGKHLCPGALKQIAQDFSDDRYCAAIFASGGTDKMYTRLPEGESPAASGLFAVKRAMVMQTGGFPARFHPDRCAVLQRLASQLERGGFCVGNDPRIGCL